MKNVLVTGAAGFIGSHLTELLVKKGYKVKAFLHYNSSNQWGWLEKSPVKSEIEVVLGDIRDYDSVYGALQGQDSVFHLAALIGIPYSYLSPLAYIKTNVEGTYNILQAARLQAIEKVIITSTSETYGSAQYTPIDEEHPLVGQSPYSASKIGADQLATSYYQSFDLPVKIVRPFNTYGPRQSARAIIPSVISQILSGQESIKLGSLIPTRDLNYVADTVNGFLAIADSDHLFGEVTNIGMNSEISIADLVVLIQEILGKKITITTDEQRIRPEKSEVNRLLCDNTKLLNNTDWRPQYTMRSGIQETANWIESNMNVFKPELYNV